MRLGLSEDQFWASTPYLLRLHIEARNAERAAQHEYDIQMAWMTGYFSRVEPLKPVYTYLPQKSQTAKQAVTDDLMKALRSFSPPPSKPPDPPTGTAS